MRIRIVTPLILLAIAITAVTLSLQYPFSAGIAPLVSGAVAAVILLLLLLREGFSKREKQSGDTQQVVVSYRPYLEVAAWVIGLVFAMWLIGASIAFTLFLFIYLRVRGESWLLSIVLSLTAFLVFYLGFERGLQITLPRGIVFS